MFFLGYRLGEHARRFVGLYIVVNVPGYQRTPALRSVCMLGVVTVCVQYLAKYMDEGGRI